MSPHSRFWLLDRLRFFFFPYLWLTAHVSFSPSFPFFSIRLSPLLHKSFFPPAENYPTRSGRDSSSVALPPPFVTIVRNFSHFREKSPRIVCLFVYLVCRTGTRLSLTKGSPSKRLLCTPPPQTLSLPHPIASKAGCLPRSLGLQEKANSPANRGSQPTASSGIRTCDCQISSPRL